MLKEVVFDGSLFATNCVSLCNDCPNLERIVMNNAAGDIDLGKLQNCPKFKGYDVNGAVGYSENTEWIPTGHFPKSKNKCMIQMENIARQWMGGSIKTSALLRTSFVAGVYYNIACGYSLANRKDDAIRVLKYSIEGGYDNYAYMKKDTDLDNIRNDERFKLLHESISEKSDKLLLLKQSAPYAKDDKDITFIYASPDDENLKRIRSYFHLDSIAGSGDEISQMKNILYWLHDAIPHDGQHGIPGKEINSIRRKEKRGTRDPPSVCSSCRYLQVVVLDLHLSPPLSVCCYVYIRMK